jgi:hypothetical protein
MSLAFDKQTQQFVIDVDRRIDGKRYRRRKRLPPGTTVDEAKRTHDLVEAKLVNRHLGRQDMSAWATFIETVFADSKAWPHRLLRAMRVRAHRKDLSCTLNEKALKDLLIDSRGRCAVTGLYFQFDDQTPGRRPFFPSVDRIDPKRGYEPDNVRVVCFAANVAMLHWGVEVFEKVAVGYVINRYCLPAILEGLAPAAPRDMRDLLEAPDPILVRGSSPAP